MRLRRLALLAAVLALPLVATEAAHARGLTPEDLVGLDRVSDPHVSPDGRRVVYDLRRTDLAANRGVHSLWLVGVDGRTPPAMQPGSQGATSPRWGRDGRLYYLKDGQVWRATPGGTDAAAVTALPLDVDSFRLTSDGRRLVVSMAVFPDAEDPAATKAREDARRADKASGRVYDHLFVRHWDTWADGTKNHLFSLAIGADGRASGSATPLTPGFDGDVPGKPFGDDSDYAISPDGRTVWFSARLAGRTEPFSTNFDLYRVPIDGSARPVDLTADNKAWDAGPVPSPDGRTIAYRAMRRPGFEADRFTVWLMDVATGRRRELTGAWDRSAGPLQWSADGREILTTADEDGRTRLFVIDAHSGAIHQWGMSAGEGHISGFDVAPFDKGQYGSAVVVRDGMDGPANLFVVYAPPPTHSYADLQLTHLNADKLAGVELNDADRFTFKGWNGDTVSGWIVKPANYQPGRKYPVAFLIHGGPQGSWTDSWSYRWNPQVYAGRGYAVVMVDFHGSTGYGQAFTDAISGHWGDRPLEDLQKGWAAALAQAPFLDASRACALGASYGGFMTYWIAGVWNAPWRCLVDHDGVFDDRMMGYSTEELWFSTWEHGGPDGHLPWQDPAAYERFNPVDHVREWSKPILVIHSEHDFRIPEEQGLAAFTAAQTKGIESKFLTFPDENHWVLKPANSLQWHHTVLDWLDAHTK